MQTKSKIKEAGKEKIQYLYDNSNSYKDVLNSLGLCGSGGSSRKTLKKYEVIWGLDKTKLEENRIKSKEKHLKNLRKRRIEEIKDIKLFLVENSDKSAKHLRKRLINENILEYKCAKCGNEGEWQGENLSLQLDHINGINNDNRIENLRFLCPNCHTQTDTWGSKNINKTLKQKEEKEKKELDKKKLLEDRRKSLENIDLTKFGWIVEVSKIWGVSHSQVRRWVNKYYPDIRTYCRNADVAEK